MSEAKHKSSDPQQEKAPGIEGRTGGSLRYPTARHSSTAIQSGKGEFTLHDCMVVTEQFYQFYLRELGLREVEPGVFAIQESQANGSPA
jgi:hypothetical protein